MVPFNSAERLFVYYQKKWEDVCKRDYSLPEPPTVTEVEDGVILPLKKYQIAGGPRAGLCEGGVCSKTGTFIAGLRRNLNNPNSNLSCTRAYPIPRDVQVRHETVVFCGVLDAHFGHLISDGFSRLWWYADHPDTEYKLVFLKSPLHGEFKLYSVLEAAGITGDRMEIITTATRFDKIIVPQEALHMLSNYRPGMEKIYNYIRSLSKPGTEKRIYLSRRALKKRDTVNEEYFEQFYRRRGYAVVYPEQLPFAEQVSLMAGAEEVVFVVGSLAQLSQFCRPGTRIVILNRSAETTASINCCIQGMGRDYWIIDAHFNFLAAKHVEGAFFLGPTIQWKRYLDTMGIPYDPDEVSVELNVKPYVYDYVIRWGEVHSNPAVYNRNIRNGNQISILDKINRIFFDEKIKASDFRVPDSVEKLKKENEALTIREETLESILRSALHDMVGERPAAIREAVETAGLGSVVIVDDTQVKQLQEKVAQLEKELYGMESSAFWRITKPLRVVMDWCRRTFKHSESEASQ